MLRVDGDIYVLCRTRPAESEPETERAAAQKDWCVLYAMCVWQPINGEQGGMLRPTPVRPPNNPQLLARPSETALVVSLVARRLKEETRRQFI